MQAFDLLVQCGLTKDQASLFKNESIDITYSLSSNLLHIIFPVTKLVPFRLYEQINNSLKERFSCEILVSLDCESATLDYQNLMKYMIYLIKEYKIDPRLLNFSTRLIEQQLYYMVNNDEQTTIVKDAMYLLSTALTEIGIRLKVNYELRPTTNKVDVKSEVEMVLPKTVAPKKTRKKTKTADFPLVAIHQLVDEVSNVKVKGVIFKIDKRVTRTNNVEVTLYLYHENDAIDAVMYLDDEDELDFKVGQSVMLAGSYQYYSFKKENRFRISDITLIEDLYPRKDEAIAKRIELHAHTKSSEMDGISDTTELVKRAYQYGHDAVAITDHMVVHSFPAAQRAMNSLNKGEHKIKVIYGVEMNMVEDELHIVSNHHSANLMNSTYIAFDVETTGLSSRLDEMIEFGAVKVVNQSVVASKQFFIKPSKEIPAYIQKLTGITKKETDTGLSLSEAMVQIQEFIGDDILVAHNARFDMRFLQEARRKLNLPPLKNTLIDTLDLSRLIIDLKRSYSLGSVARYYRIAYDQSVAHRADYDAQVLSSVLISLLADCESQGIHSTDDLLKHQQDFETFDKSMKYHVNLLAKDSQGLKELYKLVSLSHTKYLRFRGKSVKKSNESNAEPRIPRHEIEKVREHLLIGSACYNSLLFEIARTGSMEELETEMSFYDYVEIQPLSNYEPLIYTNSLKSKEELIQILKDIIFTAKKLNKLVVATGDVHYVDQEDKIFRDVYVNAIGLGGVRHPLYVYDNAVRRNNELPSQHFRTTQEMLEGYPYLDPELVKQMVIDNTQKINEQIEVIQPIPAELYTPHIEGSDDKLKEICYNNAHRIYGNPLPELVEKRLVRELNSIITNGYGVIYYTSYLLVKHSLEHGYMVGSRGSVGSSFVATMAEITEVNPLAPHYVCDQCHYHHFFVDGEYSSGYDLPNKNCHNCQTPLLREGQNIPFETFLGFEGDKVPDIDLNFSSEFQEQAHAFTKEIFGEDKVLRAGTIGTIADKTAFGHVSGYFEEHPDKQTSHSAYKEYLTQGSTGVKRSTGQHPGGIIVIPQDKDVFDFTPYQYPANNPDATWLTTHFEFNDIHDNVLKLDILGHVDPTAMKYLERVTGVDPKEIPMNDELTMSLFSSTDALMIDERRALDKNGAVGLPEFGTSFVRKILDDTKPTMFSDLVRISGLSHGTDVWLGNASELISSGQMLQDVICCRDDIMTELIQMGLDSKISFAIMESVRKGRGLKPEWIEAMNAQEVPQWYIESCLKIKYLFPKAHAVAYCMMGYRVAWFKVHRPLAFYGQFFTLRCDAYEIETLMAGSDAILARINDINSRRNSYNIENKVTNKELQLLTTLEVALEMTLRGYRFSQLNINSSPAVEFLPDPNDDKQLMIPFVAMDGLGGNVAQSIVKAREENPFLSLEDVQARTGLNSTLLNQMKKLNAVDGLSDTNQISLF